MRVKALKDFVSYLDGNHPTDFKGGEVYIDPAPADTVRRWLNAGWAKVIPEQKAKPAAPKNKAKGPAPENKAKPRTKRKRK